MRNTVGCNSFSRPALCGAGQRVRAVLETAGTGSEDIRPWIHKNMQVGFRQDRKSGS